MPPFRPNFRLSVAGLLVLAACNSARPSPTNGTPGATPTSTPSASATGSSSSSSSGGSDSGPPHGDASADAGPGAKDASPIDATIRTPTHIDDVCNVSPIAWWATAVTVDASVAPSDFATALNGLLALPNAHPFTLGAWTESAAWRFVVTATLANGIGQQYFPFDHAATSVASAPPGLTIGTPVDAAVGSAWLHVVDAASHDVWIAVEHVETHATIDDDYCTHASTGVLTATIASAAGAVTLTPLNSSSTTLGALLGPESGTGWPLRMTFDAEKVQITLK